MYFSLYGQFLKKLHLQLLCSVLKKILLNSSLPHVVSNVIVIVVSNYLYHQAHHCVLKKQVERKYSKKGKQIKMVSLFCVKLFCFFGKCKLLMHNNNIL